MKYHALLFLEKGQNFKLSSAANYRWRFKGLYNWNMLQVNRGKIGEACST